MTWKERSKKSYDDAYLRVIPKTIKTQSFGNTLTGNFIVIYINIDCSFKTSSIFYTKANRQTFGFEEL